MAAKASPLPPLAPFPKAAWRRHLDLTEWEACLDAWVSIAGAHLSYSASDFNRFSVKDESLPIFLASYLSETASSGEVSTFHDGSKSQLLRKQSFLLSYKLLDTVSPPELLVKWEYLANLSKVYGRRQGGKILHLGFKKHSGLIETDLNVLRSGLIKELDAGLKGDLKMVEIQLKKLNHFLHASPDAAVLFMAGSDFLDSLISRYKIMNPPLRKAIISTTYLCLVGLTEDPRPRISTLIDQLYSLEAAAKAHKEGPTNVNDSLVAELVTITPILKQVRQRIAASGTGSGRANSVLSSLESFKKAGGAKKPARRINRRNDKGKARAKGASDDELSQNSNGEIHVHRMSLITQVQDLFPDLGSGFVLKLLDEYNENVETVISHLLEDSLPPHLQQTDRSEGLYVSPSFNLPIILKYLVIPHHNPQEI
jgi:activating signal cointegrator complex subunit 2